MHGVVLYASLAGIGTFKFFIIHYDFDTSLSTQYDTKLPAGPQNNELISKYGTYRATLCTHATMYSGSLVDPLRTWVYDLCQPHRQGLSRYLETGCPNRGFIDFCVSKVWYKIHTTNKIDPIPLQILLF